MRSCQTFLAVTLHYNSSNNCPKPSFTRSCVGCWLVPNPFSVCVMLSNGLQSLKCVISLECEPLHVSDVTDTCTRRQRSGPVSEVPQVINNCHWGHLTCSCTALWQWIAATFIIWNGLRKSPADGKTESPLLIFLVVQVVFLSPWWLKQQHTVQLYNYSWTLTRILSCSSTSGWAERFPHTIGFKCRTLQLNQKMV